MTTAPAGADSDAARARDRLLFALTGSSGAIDAISFLALGRVFTAFMTGNTVFLGLRLSGAPTPSTAALVASMLAFAVGVHFATRLVPEEAGVWPPRVTLALALSLVGHAVFIALWLGVGGAPSPRTAPLLAGAWALAMGMQSGAVRALHVNAVYTTAATGVVIYLAANLTRPSETRIETRRLATILLCLFTGAATGGLLVQRTPLFAPLVPFAITAMVALVAHNATSLR